MPNRNFSNLLILGKNRVVIAGSFRPNAGSAISSAYFKGKGWSAVRTSSGLFTITLQEVFAQLDSANATLQLATGADQFCQIGAVDLAAKTIQVRVWDVSSTGVADVASNANNVIHFEFILRASTQEN